MSKRWVELGNEVHVVTCFPNHPTGIIPDEYKGLKYKLENMDGIHVHRNYGSGVKSIDARQLKNLDKSIEI